MVPLAVLLLLALALRSVAFEEAQTSTAGLITLIPEGLVLLMSVTLAIAAVRLARMNTLVQQMAATESLAAVDTVCIDKTGTLTDGTLELVALEVADSAEPAVAERALAGFAQRRRAQPHASDDRRSLSGRARAGGRRGLVLVRLEVERRDAGRARRTAAQLRPRCPDVLEQAGVMESRPSSGGRSRCIPAPVAGWSGRGA